MMSLKDKLTTIGLCLPGGGFRAAGFCLGILKFLQEVDLDQNIRGMSTVSGGTITGIKYAQMMKDGKSFDEFYEALYAWLKANQLTSQAVETLKDKDLWQKTYAHKRRNLINAFAIEYGRFIPGTLGELEKYCADEHTSIKRFIFNSTDFNHGVEFRFQNKDVPQRDFGNAYQDRYYRNIREYILLGDIAAASSCFPAGFEPMAFPGDFIKHQDVMDKIPSAAEPLGLMDGGIIDNQGSSSFTTSEKLPYSFYGIGDVGSSKTAPFTFSDELPTAKWISLLFNKWVFLLFLVITITALVFNLPFFKYILLVLTSILGILHLILLVAYNYAGKTAGIQGSFYVDHRLLGIYILDRIRSILTLNNVIFLRGAKSRNISIIFNKASNRTEKISIYELADYNEKLPEDQDTHRHRLHTLIRPIPAHLIEASTAATNFGTTLWFDDGRGDMLDTLILVGRATTCLSLMSFLLKSSDVETCKRDPFFNQLLVAWKNL